jgi:phage tail sheath protein FI
MTINYETKAPGVYLEEITPAGPIAGAGTSVAAFIGRAAKVADPKDLGTAVPVTNWTVYTGRFGDYDGISTMLPFAVRGFFENGGTLAYVVAVDPVNDQDEVDAALAALTRRPDVSLVCAPGLDIDVQRKVLDHCSELRDRFAVLDGVPDDEPLEPTGPLQAQRGLLTSDNGFGALYWPWILIPDPTMANRPGPAPADQPPKPIAVPPSGHVAGVMARCDNTVGVHKAPANEVVRGAVDLQSTVNDAEHGRLNQLNINVIRQFPGGPPRIWGARTLTEQTQWRHVNVRRLVSFIEDSLTQGLRWAVFAPNNLSLWKGLERTITEFLTRVWEAGALFGATPQEAFYVLINEELNPPSVRNRGQVIVEIGLAPTRPAEWVVLRVGLWDGGARITEG